MALVVLVVVLVVIVVPVVLVVLALVVLVLLVLLVVLFVCNDVEIRSYNSLCFDAALYCTPFGARYDSKQQKTDQSELFRVCSNLSQETLNLPTSASASTRSSRSQRLCRTTVLHLVKASTHSQQ